MGRLILTIASFLLLAAESIAQEKEADLDPVTITASLVPEKISKTGRNVLVIRGDQFYDLPVHSIDELLRYLPGIEVQSRGPMGAQSDIVLRGGTFQQVLVIVDGIRLNDPNTGHFTSYIPVAPAEIDRVEILKGASSAVYGSEAVGGVIHIITKTFAAKKSLQKSNAVMQLTAGQFGLFNANAGGFFSNGKTAIGLGFLTNNADGQQQRGIKGFFHNHTGSVSINHFFNEHWQLALRSSYDKRKFAAQNFYTTFVSDTAREEVSTLWNQLQLTYNARKNSIHLYAGYKKLNDHYSFNAASIPNQNKSELLQALITNEWKLQTKTTITSGLQYLNKQIRSNDRGNHNVDQAAGFVIWNQQVGDQFFIAPAARVEWNERAGWEMVPQINLSYKTNQLQLRASSGKTIRDADFTERFNNYNKTLVTGGRIGYPDLVAERSFSYEAGADYFISPALKLSGTFFQRLHSKLIDYVQTAYDEMPRKDNLSPSGIYALAKNIAEVNTTGIETDIQLLKNIGAKQRVRASAGLVLLNSQSSDTTPSFYISSHARYLANFNVQYTNSWILFSVSGLYKDRQPQSTPSAAIAKVSKNYFLLHTKAEGFVWRKKLSVFAEVDNVFDVSYTDLLGAQMPGRWIMGGIKIILSK